MPSDLVNSGDPRLFDGLDALIKRIQNLEEEVAALRLRQEASLGEWRVRTVAGDLVASHSNGTTTVVLATP